MMSRERSAFRAAPPGLFEHGTPGAPGAGQCWKRIVVCGNDFGMNAAIDVGVLRLAELGRLSAISCLTQGSTFAHRGGALKDQDLDLGVHLNLTELLGHPGQAAVLSLPALIARAYTGRLGQPWLEDQLNRQFDAFETVLGRAPEYVDGHRHVHQLPGVLPCLLRLLERRYGHRMPWLRQTGPGMQEGIPLSGSAKARLVAALGAEAVARVRCATAGAPTGGCSAFMTSRAARAAMPACCSTGCTMRATATC